MLKVEEKNIDDLIFYEKNPKAHSRTQINSIAKSIQEFGFLVPIVISKDNVIIAGHGRVLAAKKLNLKKVPTIIADHLTEEQIKAFRIIDNKVAESPWIEHLLKQEIQDIKNFDFSEFFTDNELNKLLDNPVIDNSQVIEQKIFQLIIDFNSEEELREGFNKLKNEGYTCRVLIL